MKNTAGQTTTKTLADLYRALDRHHAVTITYRDSKGAITVRTIEPFQVSTTSNGRIRVRAMCRLRRDARAFFIDEIESYTLHRIGFALERPASSTTSPPAPVHSENALIAYELERDTIATACRSRVGLAA
jgi:predicted DNA-binding transcriptional regulator YafY